MSAFIWSFLAGLGLHQTASFTRKLPHGWEQLAGTTIGVIGTSPLFVLWLKKLNGTRNPFTWAVSAFFLAFLGVGSGVAFGWTLDTIFGIDRTK